MQVTETSSVGLKRELRVVVAAGELNDRFSRRLSELQGQVALKGFRPGKVPVAHLKRFYGRSVMAEVLQQAVSETSQKAIEERQERAAYTPEIKLTEDQGEIESILVGKSDLAFGMAYEVLPRFELSDLGAIALERPVAEVAEADIDKSIANLVEGSIGYEAEADRAAGEGDKVVIDFEGFVDGAPFEGNKGEDADVVIGRGGFIPGFEEGLKGAKAGEDRELNVTFPDPYPAANLAGKPATFKVKVKEVAKPVRPEVDEAFAKRFGFPDVARLREAVKGRLTDELSQVSRQVVKRKLLDALDGSHSFELPPTLVENEFKEIWERAKRDLERAGKTLAEEGKTEETEQAEYRKLAERRVRLGLVLSEIGERNQIRVSDDEMARAITEQARNYPGQESNIYKFYRENPRALLQVRAPIYEEKVVNFIVERAKVTDLPVSSEELMKSAEADDEATAHVHDHHGHDHGHDHHHDHDHDHHHDHDHDHHGHHHHGHDHEKK